MIRIKYLAAALLAATAPAAMAQDADMLKDLAILSEVVNWAGIFQAVVVIFIAWLLLRFVDRLVDRMGSTMAERRLLLQRLNAFFHFFVYFTAIAFILEYSLDFSPQVLTIIGGTVAVAIGFGDARSNGIYRRRAS